jgi:parallel beta-helix repeat protein
MTPLRDRFAFRPARRSGRAAALLSVALGGLLVSPLGTATAAAAVDEVHYTYTGPTSVAFDWRGSETDIRYGTTADYGQTATASAPNPLPISSSGPFQEVELTGLQPGTTYHYSIGGDLDQTFTTAPTGDFRFDVIADVGSSHDYSNIPIVMSQIAADSPAFVLGVGDLTYGTPFGAASVDQHFNDVMAWSRRAAYMPVWGNHEYENPATDDLRNYKGRFMLPHAQAVPQAPAAGCCGEDWSWFDAGGVRFISYPEPYTSSTWASWQSAADGVFAAAQADPSIHFIVTFGHRPAYSTGFHAGEVNLQTALNALGDTYSKYVLNLNGHSHDYERFDRIHGVTHITTGGGGSSLETPWSGSDSRTIFRALHLEHMRIDVSDTGMRVDAICGPPTTRDDISCVQGSVIDSFTIGTNPPPPPPPPAALYVNQQDPNCSDGNPGTAAQPFCNVKPAAQRVVAGQTVLVGSGTYNEEIFPSGSGTASAPITFAAAPGAKPVVTGTAKDHDGVYISGRSYITVQGFTTTGTIGDGIVVKNSSNITIRGNEVTRSGLTVQGSTAKGIRVENSTDCLITTNRVHDNSYFGIYLVTGSTRNHVIGNETYKNAAVYNRLASGIRLYQSPGNTIAYNVTHDNEDSGIELFSSSNDNLVVGNISYNNGDHGIDDNASTGERFIANTVYNNVTAGINAEGGSTGATIANNISVDNGINSPRTKSNIRVDATSTTQSTADYDLVSLRTSGTMMIWGNTSYSSLAAFVTATGKETHGQQADPRWEDPAHGDFDLTPGSPAIDSADSGATGQPSTDAFGEPRTDDPRTPNTGVGPRAYDDRGALEYIPEVVDAPPSAVLTVAPTGGTAPLAVTADASGSTDDDATPIDTYTFDFGDGTAPVGPQASPTAAHTYTSSGTHTVRVTVVDRGGLASSATTQVTVVPAPDAPPSAQLVATPASGNAPLNVTLDASGSTDTDDSPIATYRFDFGDGTAPVGPQAGATAAHAYTTTGTYTATVTVTDTQGKAGTATTQVTVFAAQNLAPVARLTVTTSTDPMAPLHIAADASASTDTDDHPIATYRFDFGDGMTTGDQAAATAAHDYALPGSYTVKVTVTDTGGLSSTATTTLAVDLDDPPPTATLSVSPRVGAAPLDVTADASASTDGGGTPIASYRFDFGDGTVTGDQTSATATHRYPGAGTYTVTVTVTDTAHQTATASRQVQVTGADAPPSATLTASPGSGTAPLPVTADASGSTDGDATPIATYTFDFGDGSAAVGPQPGATAAHTYTAAGTYTITVTVTDTGGLSSTATTQVTVNRPDLPPNAVLSVTPSAGVAPLAATADASGSTDDDSTPIDTYKFDFGDGTAVVGPQAAAVATHTYTDAGTFTVKVTVTDTAGKAATATTQVTVFANFATNPGFETDLAGWNTSGSTTGASLTRVAGGHSGGWAARLTNPTSAALNCTLNDSPDSVKPAQPGTTYTAAMWVRADAPLSGFKLRIREYTGSTLAGTATTQVNLTTAWQLVTVTYKAVNTGSSLDVNGYASSVPAGASFYVDDVTVTTTG